jgi:hypothetical protein
MTLEIALSSSSERTFSPISGVPYVIAICQKVFYFLTKEARYETIKKRNS